MTTADVVPAFLAVCPSIDQAWREYLAFWGGEPQRGHYNDASVVAQHLVDSYERGEVGEYQTAFAVLERCLSEGDVEARNLAVVGVVEGIQNLASHRPFGPEVFLPLLGPLSRAAWEELCVFWGQVAEGKAAGLLGPSPDLPGSPAINPLDVHDPGLRRIIEQLYRK